MKKIVLNGWEDSAYERAKLYVKRGESFEAWVKTVHFVEQDRILEIWNLANMQ